MALSSPLHCLGVAPVSGTGWEANLTGWFCGGEGSRSGTVGRGLPARWKHSSPSGEARWGTQSLGYWGLALTLSFPLDDSRAQGYHRGTGQCGKDHHSLPAVSDPLMQKGGEGLDLSTRLTDVWTNQQSPRSPSLGSRFFPVARKSGESGRWWNLPGTVTLQICGPSPGIPILPGMGNPVLPAIHPSEPTRPGCSSETVRGGLLFPPPCASLPLAAGPSFLTRAPAPLSPNFVPFFTPKGEGRLGVWLSSVAPDPAEADTSAE